jgi:uncharacterized membrane protein YtjA (UPF0391 family)
MEQTGAARPATLVCTAMLQTIAIILLVLWLLGTVTAYTMGGLVHILLVLAVVLFVVQLLSGRRVV